MSTKQVERLIENTFGNDIFADARAQDRLAVCKARIWRFPRPLYLQLIAGVRFRVDGFEQADSALDLVSSSSKPDPGRTLTPSPSCPAHWPLPVVSSGDLEDSVGDIQLPTFVALINSQPFQLKDCSPP